MSEEEITKRQILKGEIAKIEDRLHNLKKRDRVDDDDNDDDDSPPPAGGSASGSAMCEAEMDPTSKRFLKKF